MAERGLVIAGLNSGSGKTTITLGLLKAMVHAGHDVCAAKCGPDYIDGAFLSAASGRPAVNLDAHAMPAAMLHRLAATQPGRTLIIEGVMGLFDGTDGGSGSTASLATSLGIAVILVIDCRHQAQTAAAIAAGLATQLSEGASLSGVILNRVASPRHGALITEALTQRGVHCFGCLPSDDKMAVPSRHLGLVQAADLAANSDLDPRIDAAARLVGAHLNLEGIIDAATPLPGASCEAAKPCLPVPGQRIAVANDRAFGFAYHHVIEDWQTAGAEILSFSPLKNEAPRADSDFIFLPGGYPELHLAQLSTAEIFLDGLRKAAARGTPIYGECGGYMTLGKSITDAEGQSFPMANLLQLETSFANRKLHLGYRHLTLAKEATALWPGLDQAVGHEFHYTTATKSDGKPLFSVADPTGAALGMTGLIESNVFGSYAHMIAAGD